MKARAEDIFNIIEEHFPLVSAEEWDNTGMQLGDRQREVDRILVTLDVNRAAVDKAMACRVNMIISHHPLFFKAVKRIDLLSYQGQIIKDLVKADIDVYSAHTNLDAGYTCGVSQILAERLGLTDIQPLGNTYQEELIKLAVFVPVSHVDQVRQAINAAGAGHTGNYSDCSFRARGTGTFKPGEGTNPFTGSYNQLQEVEEYRLETILCKPDLPQILTAMQAAHPYEEVAYDVYRLQNPGRIFSPGRKGSLENPVTLENFLAEVKNNLHIDSLRFVGDLKREIARVAVVSGAGASFINAALAEKMDILVTGDIKYHEALEAELHGMAVIDAGHQETEEIVIPSLCELLSEECIRRDFQVELIPFTSSRHLKYV